MSEYTETVGKRCNCDSLCPKRKTNIFDTDGPTIRGLMQERDEIQALFNEQQDRLRDMDEYIHQLKEVIVEERQKQNDDAIRIRDLEIENESLFKKMQKLKDVIAECGMKLNLLRVSEEFK